MKRLITSKSNYEWSIQLSPALKKEVDRCMAMNNFNEEQLDILDYILSISEGNLPPEDVGYIFSDALSRDQMLAFYYSIVEDDDSEDYL